MAPGSTPKNTRMPWRVEAVAGAIGVPYWTTQSAVDAVLSTITETLAAGGEDAVHKPENRPACPRAGPRPFVPGPCASGPFD